MDLMALTSGVGSELGLNAQTIQQTCREYAARRYQFKRAKLSWRKSSGSNRSLGWIPCTNQNVKLEGDQFRYGGKTFRFWKSRDIPDTVKSVSINEDSRGRWYVNFMCEIADTPNAGILKLGIDLGLKTQASLSDGRKFERENLTKKYEHRLALAQRCGHKHRTRTIHAKIKNTRRDWNHKTANTILKDASFIVIGNVSSTILVKTSMAKSVLDASWCQLRSFLKYKAIGLGAIVKDVNESWTTATCSSCLNRTGPSGLSGLSVREWMCSVCGEVHDRDTNAAKNILRLGHETPTKGSPTRMPKSSFLSLHKKTTPCLLEAEF